MYIFTSNGCANEVFLIINFLPLFLAFDANSATSQICTIFSEFCPFVRYDAKHKYPSMDYGGVWIPNENLSGGTVWPTLHSLNQL